MPTREPPAGVVAKSSGATATPNGGHAPRAAWLALIVAAAVTVFSRWHTLTEPLDCDEAAYAYVGHRLLAGDRLYADVFENKPPGTYLIFAAAIAVGGYSELTIRLLSVPFVLATLACIWAVARRLAGDFAAVLAALFFAIVSHDPFTFGETANLEVFMNAFMTLALYASVRSWCGSGWRWPALAGLTLGLASIVKQVVVPHGLLMLAVLWMSTRRTEPSRWRGLWLRQSAALLAGCLVPWLLSLGLCAYQGVTGEFLHAVFVYGPTLTAEAAKGQGWDRLIRFVTGNPGVGWWGTGTWPLLLAAAAAAAYGLVARRGLVNLATAWTLACYLEVFLPRMFFQHYYLLPLPGLAVLAGVVLARWREAVRQSWPAGGFRPRMAGAAWLACTVALVGSVAALQYEHYWRLAPHEIGRHKDGYQWVVHRALGRKLGEIAGPDDRLFDWGWHSPLHFYSRMDSVTPYFFTDPLMVTYSTRWHRLVEPRKQRILADIHTHRPTIVVVEPQPFPELRKLLRQEYRIVQLSVGDSLFPLYVRPDCVARVRAAFEPRADQSP